MAGKGTRSDANKEHAHPLTRTVRQRSQFGPVKINVSIPGSVAVSVSVRMESYTVHFYCFDFYGIHIYIRTNGITPLYVYLLSIFRLLLPQASPQVHLHVVGMSRVMSMTWTNRACPLLLICSYVCFCLNGPFNCISSHKFSRQLPFSDPVLTALSLPCWSFQVYVSLWKSPWALI